MMIVRRQSSHACLMASPSDMPVLRASRIAETSTIPFSTEIPDNVKKNLEIIAVSHVDEVIGRALVKKPEAITWAEPEETPAPRAGEGTAVGTVLPH